ncbi:MAG: MotA/TolQ/ExbB proton channel family protein [SAR86 cluster bacterium]|jgi:biopolymer transport protein ExbB|uniref:MotA/TolQ/ExbB proton channel family protein n=1 Tax=SAR86 cluster bacterium TaxID=2030880 RepID=A0A937LZW5_9GAMM|nr:MotA/TolQ/ExbB proton channel family protein [SAR86 cluster bacterium]MDG1721809.1 MotA/TolQ/ExbB proton channel family protein [SAR86 cluster bacterium]|tara:strand:+ start:880 stop:1404 length:525 start_codon:yes stop_codon:yes gene_type:complete
MLYYLLLPFSLVSDFINLGGTVLIVLFFVAVYMWVLISERIYFYRFILDDFIDSSFSSYKDLIGKDDWVNNKIKDMSLADINLKKNKNLNQIKGLVALCPLLGLLGTVTGMIEVFDVMAFTGTGNPRLMAGGISKATLPTMTGLVISITGLFAITFLERFINDRVSNKIEVFEK